MREARDGGAGLPLTDSEIPSRVAGAMWDPQYLPLVRPDQDGRPDGADGHLAQGPL